MRNMIPHRFRYTHAELEKMAKQMDVEKDGLRFPSSTINQQYRKTDGET